MRSLYNLESNFALDDVPFQAGAPGSPTADKRRIAARLRLGRPQTVGFWQGSLESSRSASTHSKTFDLIRLDDRNGFLNEVRNVRCWASALAEG